MVDATPTQETTVRAIASPATADPTATAGPCSDTPTSPPRDLTVDALRALAIVAVAVGHWLVVVPSYTDGRFDGVNALATVPLMRGLTWIFQVMPLFFVLGGYANAHSWRSARRRGVTYHEWVRTRLVRLLRPSVAFVGVWVVVGAGLRLVGTDPELVRRLGWLAVVPVWFLAVYVVVVALAPAMLALHERFGPAVLVVLAVIAAGVDGVRLGTDVDGIEWSNFLWVFLFAQQLGFCWVDGQLTRRRWTAPLLAVGGLVVLVLLTTVGPYPFSLVGVPGEAVANNAPPTITLVALGMAQTGLAILVRPAIARLLERPRVLGSVVGLNVHAMTMLLWHFSALILVAVVLLPLGIVPTNPDGSAAWWAVRLAAVVVMTGPLLLLVTAFGRVERTGVGYVLPRAERPAGSSRRAVPAGVLVVAVLAAAGLSAYAFAQIAVRGLSPGREGLGLPVVPVVLLIAAAALVTWAAPCRDSAAIGADAGA